MGKKGHRTNENTRKDRKSTPITIYCRLIVANRLSENSLRGVVSHPAAVLIFFFAPLLLPYFCHYNALLAPLFLTINRRLILKFPEYNSLTHSILMMAVLFAVITSDRKIMSERDPWRNVSRIIFWCAYNFSSKVWRLLCRILHVFIVYILSPFETTILNKSQNK